MCSCPQKRTYINESFSRTRVADDRCGIDGTRRLQQRRGFIDAYNAAGNEPGAVQSASHQSAAHQSAAHEFASAAEYDD
jgi:hypothetical protein